MDQMNLMQGTDDPIGAVGVYQVHVSVCTIGPDRTNSLRFIADAAVDVSNEPRPLKLGCFGFLKGKRYNCE